MTRARDMLAESDRRVTRSHSAQPPAVDNSGALQSAMDGPDPSFPGHGIAMSGLRCSLEEEASNSDEVVSDIDVADADDFGGADTDYSDQEVDDSDLPDAENDNVPEETQPCSQGRDELRDFVDRNSFFAPLMRAETAGIELLNVLRKTKAPINAYPQVMDWHLRETKVLKRHQGLKDAGKEHYIGRKALLNRLQQRYNLEDKGPVNLKVRLPSSKEVVKIPVFDAEECIVQLLTNPRLEPEDFDFFNDDPLAPPPESSDIIGNCNTGSAFRDTYKALVKEPGQQLVGVLYYIDGAVTGQFSDLPVTAVKISLSIFTRKARLRPDMWATLGYLPHVKISKGRGKKLFVDSGHMEADDLHMMDGEGEQIDVDGNISDDSDVGLTEIKAQDFHFMLSVILKSYLVLQQRGMLWTFMHRQKRYPAHLLFFVVMCRCDTEEADALCGKYKPRTRNIKHICRQCHVPTMEASDHLARYPLKTQEQIEKLVKQQKTDQLQSISQHYLKNCWNPVRFNQANKAGIHGACPSEMLHQLQLGIFRYYRDIFFDYI